MESKLKKWNTFFLAPFPRAEERVHRRESRAMPWGNRDETVLARLRNLDTLFIK